MSDMTNPFILYMQQQSKSALKSQHQSILLALLKQFLSSPSPDNQYQLALFHPYLYLSVITNSSHSRDIRVACCSAMKIMMTNRELFTPHSTQTLQQLQSIYINGDESVMNGIQGSLQILLQKIFELYLGDQLKLKIFQDLMEQMTRNSDIRRSRLNERSIKLGLMLVQGMDCSTLNNQICVGGLICFLKQNYYEIYLTKDEYNINGRGLKILTNLMSQSVIKQNEAYLISYLQTQIAVVQLIKTILSRLQQQNDAQCVPAAYINNSKQIQNLLQSIIICGKGSILGSNRFANQLKSQVLQLYSDCFIYHAKEQLFLACINTVVTCTASQLIDYADQIVTSVLMMLERSINIPDYATYFYKNTQLLVIKLMEIISIRQSQLEIFENDPQNFVDISDDFCKTQQSNSVKSRAGSLLYSLCLSIDGNLTFVSNMALIPLHCLEYRAVKNISSDILIRPGLQKSQSLLQSLMQLWPKTAQQLTQTCILILSSISDLVIKRPELSTEVTNHLSVMLKIFKQKQSAISFFPPLIICRYIQLVSYFSFPYCLDPFLSYYSVKPVYEQTILKSLETIIHYHDKKIEQMRMYVTKLSTSVLMMSQKLTPLLEKTIVTRPQMILCIKERLVQKLTLWLIRYYQIQNLFGCNKISNLLCKVIQKYPQFLVQTQQLQFNYDLMALTQYLTPLYKLLLGSKLHPAQQCIVDIAVNHVQCLGARLDNDLAHQFLKMGVKVVEHNGLVLNKCLQLFSRLICIPNLTKNSHQPEYIKLQKIHAEIAKDLTPFIFNWIQKIQQQRDYDIWQLLFLLQITLLVVDRHQIAIPFVNLDKLFAILLSSKSKIVKIKIFFIFLILVKIHPDPQGQPYNILISQRVPALIPPYQKNNFIVILLRIINSIKNIQYRAYLIQQSLKLMYPDQKYKEYILNYQEKLYCSSKNDAETEIAAFHTAKEVLHPLNCWPTDAYKQFREMFNNMKIEQWNAVHQLLPTIDDSIRETLSRQVIGQRPRRIIHVRKTMQQ